MGFTFKCSALLSGRYSTHKVYNKGGLINPFRSAAIFVRICVQNI